MQLSRCSLLVFCSQSLMPLLPSGTARSGIPLLAARGFGRPEKPPAVPSLKLDADAAALLDEAGGDAVKARSNYIGYTLAYLQDADPELYNAIKTDPKRPDCHEVLVELTWDAIAAASLLRVEL